MSNAATPTWLSDCYVQIENLDVPEDTVDDAMEKCMSVLPVVLDLHESPAYQAKRELAANYLADQYIRDHPTLPPDSVDSQLSWCDIAATKRAVGAGPEQAAPPPADPCDWHPRADAGFLYPQHHCAFKGCTWHGKSAEGEAQSLAVHLKLQHDNVLKETVKFADPVEDLEFTNQSPDGWLPLYYAALAVKESAKMPTVGSSVDRRCIDHFLERHNTENLSALMCFTCARVLPHDKQDLTSEIHWREPFDGKHFGRMDSDVTAATIGLETYLAEYGRIPAPSVRADGKQPEPRDLSMYLEEFDDWKLTVPFSDGDVNVLCCSEDIKCVNDHNDGKLCTDCQVPICNECWSAIDNVTPHRPKLALSNDLWFGYLPQVIYDTGATYMELLCASVCHPTMLSFQVNCYGWDHKKEEVHMQRHRVGARGNMTAFQVPWENVFSEMQKVRDAGQAQLPRTGTDLLQLVQVLLQKNGADLDDGDKKQLLKSATVRRDVVLKLIQANHNSGHREYANLDMKKVEKKLYEWDHTDDTVPQEVLVELSSHKRNDDKVEEDAGGKAAVAPDPLVTKGDDPLKDGRVMSMACERSSCADLDDNTQFVAAMLETGDRLQADAGRTDDAASDEDDMARAATMHLTMGPARSQLEATFFLTAYAFLFPHSIGAPDLKYQPRDRYSVPASHAVTVPASHAVTVLSACKSRSYCTATIRYSS